MKKYLLTIFFLLFLYSTQMFGAITGSGTPADPFIISEPADLVSFMNETTAIAQGYWVAGTYTELAADLDMGTITGESPIGSNNTPNSRYKGNFDGKGHSIRNLYINLSSTVYVGLFGFTDGANISNLGVEDANITGDTKVGIFCGHIKNSNITNCYATGSAEGNGNVVGGFSGDNYNSTISNCYVTGSVNGDSYIGGFCGYNNNSTIENCYSQGSADGFSYVGGFCGYNLNSTISNCYVTGSANGSSYIGGFCGYNNNSTIENCYSQGSADGFSYVGGFVGENNSGIYNCCFWGFEGANLDDTGDDGDLGSQYIKELAPAQFVNATNFAGCFDFETIWVMGYDVVDSEYPYPMLRAFGYSVIPTLTEWAVIIFIGLLAGVGGWFVWRRMV